MNKRTDVVLVIEPTPASQFAYTVFHMYDWRNLSFIRDKYQQEHVVKVGAITFHVCTHDRYEEDFVRELVVAWLGSSNPDL